MESDEGRNDLENMREEGRETEVGERMNGASKIGRERGGEKEDERTLGRERAQVEERGVGKIK